MLFDKSVPVENMEIALGFANDLAVSTRRDGGRLVIRSLHLSSFGKETSVPIVGGRVSQKAVERALREIGAHIE